jgi:N-glycosylase/DNA lyase
MVRRPVLIRRCVLRLPAPFELRTVARSHGWFDLPPLAWDEQAAELSLAFCVDGGAPVTVAVTQARGALAGRVASFAPLSAAELRAVKATLRRCLRLDEDLGELYALADGHERLDWIGARGAGRILRAPTPFEDLVKILCTTNCSWALTRSMVTRLCAVGRPAPGGRRTFPSPVMLARRPERFFREVVRAGYRAPNLLRLSRMAARGEIDLLRWAQDDVDSLRARLLALPGIGPYATAHLLRLLGHYADLGIDSWCRAKYQEIYGLRRPPSDGAIARRYQGFGRFAGLALWLDLTRDWHVAASAAPTWP